MRKIGKRRARPGDRVIERRLRFETRHDRRCVDETAVGFGDIRPARRPQRRRSYSRTESDIYERLPRVALVPRAPQPLWLADLVLYIAITPKRARGFTTEIAC